MENIKLYSHQARIIKENPSKTLLCHDTGVGKTITALGVAYNDTDDVLVICPKAIKEKWVRDAEKYLTQFHPNAVRPKVVTKEEFRRDAKKLDSFHALIIDEAHYFGGLKSQMHKSIIWYVQHNNPKKIIAATATPYLSTPWNIFAIAKILGHSWSWIAFKSKFFDEKYLFNRTIPVVKKGIEGQIAALVNSIGSVVDISACGDVPPQVDELEYFVLTKEQIKTKEQVKLDETNPVVKYLKYYQIDNGTLRGNEYVDHQFIENGKTAFLLEMAQQNKKLAIVCGFNLQIDVLKDKLQAAGYPVLVIRGDTKNRDAVVAEAEKAESAIVLIQAKCSEGYELPSFGVIAFASLSNSYKDYKQIRGRFLRGNKLKKNVFVHLVTKDSVDEAWFASIMRKQDFSLAIYAREQGEVVSLEDEEGSILSDEV